MVQQLASEGDPSAIEKVLRRPILTEEAEPYYEAFDRLHRDRTKNNMSLGMAGSIQLPNPISRALITSEGERLGYEGEDLEDFVDIVMGIDDYFVEVEAKRVLAETKTTLDRTRARGR